MPDWITTPTAISALISVISGAFGAFFAPWAHWGVEKHRELLNQRRLLIKQWREVISPVDFERESMLSHPSYGPLRVLLAEETRTRLERPKNHLAISISGRGIHSQDKDSLIREIARIEKEWGLI